MADVAIATETARFRLPKRRSAWCPRRLHFLVERLGYSQAKRLAVTGGRLDATQALAVGLVHQQVATGEVDAAVQTRAGRHPGLRARVLAATKALMAKARWSLPPIWWTKRRHLLARRAGPEGQEGTSAFLPKRKPTWVPA